MRGMLLGVMAIGVAGTLAIVGCAATEGHPVPPAFDADIDPLDSYPSQIITTVGAVHACTATTAQLQELVERQKSEFSAYRVDYDDAFSISVLDHPEWASDVVVLRDGNIQFGFLRSPVPVIGRTFQEIEDLLRVELQKYFFEPQIKIHNIRQSQNSYTVKMLGAFNTPGRAKLRVGYRLWDAITDAGGFLTSRGVLSVSETTPQLPIVDLSRAVILREVRYVPDGTAPEGLQLSDVCRLNVDFQELVNGDPQQNIPLFPGDVIYVPPFEPENSRVLVVGEVGTPGVFYFRERMNLIEALARAGWIRETSAKYTGIYLVRHSLGDDDQREVYILNAINVVKGRARNFNLRNGDIIYVDTDGLHDINVVLGKLVPFLSFPQTPITTFKAIRDIDK